MADSMVREPKAIRLGTTLLVWMLNAKMALIRQLLLLGRYWVSRALSLLLLVDICEV
jgi:hypothetical protein